MKRSFRIGFNFGLTSGIITTLGLMVGLHSSTDSKFVVIGGILTIAIADAFAESMGVHFATESETKITKKEVYFYHFVYNTCINFYPSCCNYSQCYIWFLCFNYTYYINCKKKKY